MAKDAHAKKNRIALLVQGTIVFRNLKSLQEIKKISIKGLIQQEDITYASNDRPSKYMKEKTDIEK
jgi:hypothetical protein